MIVHLLRHGMTPHPMPMPPSKWPEGHLWAGQEDEGLINCPDCLEAIGLKDIPIYTLGIEPPSITCLRCKRTSENPYDVEKRYCGYCHAFLDDIWPPAKKSWLEGGNNLSKCQE